MGTDIQIGLISLKDFINKNDILVNNFFKLRTKFFGHQAPEDCLFKHYEWLAKSPEETWCVVALDNKKKIIGHVGIHKEKGIFKNKSICVYTLFDVFVVSRYRKQNIHKQLMNYAKDHFLEYDSVIIHFPKKPFYFRSHKSVSSKVYTEAQFIVQNPFILKKNPYINFIPVKSIHEIASFWKRETPMLDKHFRVHKNKRWLEWRYLQHPARKYLLYICQGAGWEIALICRISSYRGIPLCIIIDFQPFEKSKYMANITSILQIKLKKLIIAPIFCKSIIIKGIKIPSKIRRRYVMIHCLKDSIFSSVSNLLITPADKISY